MPLAQKIAVATALAILPIAAQAQDLVTQKNIPLAMAETIANAALEQCEKMGYKVSVTVVDRAGLALVAQSSG